MKDQIKVIQIAVCLLIMSMSIVCSSPGEIETRGNVSEKERETMGAELLQEEGSSDQPVNMAEKNFSYTYSIDELGLDLDIPVDLYVCRIPGVYRDWTGRINIHDFSTWIVITDIEYGEDALAQVLKDRYEEEAEHIVLIISLTCKELYPVEELCWPVFAYQGDLPRVTENRYCRFLNSCEFLNREDGQTYQKTEELSQICDPEEVKQFYAGKEKVTAPWVNAIEKKTVPAMYLGPTAAYIISFNVSDNFYRDTIADERFWEIYQKAVEELTDSPEKYVYDEEKNTSRIVEWETFAQSDIEFNETLRDETLKAIYSDSQKDISIRAWCYARCVLGYEIMHETDPTQPMKQVSLNDFTVLLLDWDHGQRSFIVFYENYGEFGFGYDYFIDLGASRQYIEKWESLRY